jgi:hypothetical protein
LRLGTEFRRRALPCLGAPRAAPPGGSRMVPSCPAAVIAPRSVSADLASSPARSARPEDLTPRVVDFAMPRATKGRSGSGIPDIGGVARRCVRGAPRTCVVGRLFRVGCAAPARASPTGLCRVSVRPRAAPFCPGGVACCRPSRGGHISAVRRPISRVPRSARAARGPDVSGWSILRGRPPARGSGPSIARPAVSRRSSLRAAPTGSCPWLPSVPGAAITSVRLDRPREFRLGQHQPDLCHSLAPGPPRAGHTSAVCLGRSRHGPISATHPSPPRAGQKCQCCPVASKSGAPRPIERTIQSAATQAGRPAPGMIAPVRHNRAP